MMKVPYLLSRRINFAKTRQIRIGLIKTAMARIVHYLRVDMRLSNIRLVSGKDPHIFSHKVVQHKLKAQFFK